MQDRPWTEKEVLLIQGRWFYLTRHALDRAAEMGIPHKLIRHIIEGGTSHRAPNESKYRGSRVVVNGKVGAAVRPREDGGEVIATFLWTTVDAWREAAQTGGRHYRGDKWTASMLDKWFGQ